MNQMIAKVAAYVDDYSNPIVIKEIRQGTRSKTFLIFFALLLCGAMVIAAFAPGAMGEYGDSAVGDSFFYAFSACLIVIAFGAMPWLAFRTVVSERDQGTWDMLRVSGLNPHRLVLGKFNASLLQLVVFFSAVVPFMAMSFLLRGIDILTVMATCGAIMFSSIVMIIGAIWIASLASTRAQAILLQIIVIIACVTAVWLGLIGLLSAGISELLTGRPVLVGDSDFWWMALAFLIGTVANFLLFYSLAVIQFTFDTANRSTLPRVAFTLWLAAALGAQLMLAYVNGLPLLTTWAEFGMTWAALIFLGGMIAVTERPVITRRVQQQVRGGLWHLLQAFLFPGPGRGFLWMLFCLLVPFCIVPAVLLLKDGRRNGVELLWVAAYVLIYAGLVSAIVRGLGRGRIPVVNIRWLTLLVSLLLMLLPWLAYVFLGGMSGRGPEVLLILHPFQAISEDLSKDPVLGPSTSIVLVILSVVTLAIYVRSIVHDLAEQGRLAARNRRPSPESSSARPAQRDASP